MTQVTEVKSEFLTAFKGSFYNMLRWHELDALWEKVKIDSTPWYVYAIGEVPPEQALSKEQLMTFIEEIDRLLHEEHEEDYCGIVYADNRETPSFIKIYDPNNLGVVCGFSENPPLPGWVMSKIAPEDLNAAFPPTGSRKRWWKRLFG